MKKILLMLAMVVAAVFSIQAQCPDRPDPKMLKQIQEYKIKFLAQEMELKADQKEKFVELYQKFSAERHANFEKMRACEATLKNNPSDADYKSASDAMADLRVKDAALEKKYDKEFAKFLTHKQIYLMKQGEEKFRRKMTDMHHKRKHSKGKRKADARNKTAPAQGANK